jgi:hypothetical protein
MTVNLKKSLPVRFRPHDRLPSPESVGANYRLIIDSYEKPKTNAELALALSRLIVSKRVGRRQGTLLFSTTNTPEGCLGIGAPDGYDALYEKSSDVPPLLYRKSRTGKYAAVTALAELPTYCDPSLRTKLLADIDYANQLSGSHMLGNPRGHAQEEMQQRLLAEATRFHARVGHATLLDIPNPFSHSVHAIPYELDCSGVLNGDSLTTAMSMAADMGEVRNLRAQYVLGVLTDMPLH